MNKRPKIVKYGFGFCILGGMIAIVASIVALDLSAYSTIAYVSLNLLVAALFFGVGGAFVSGGPGNSSSVAIMAALTTGVVIAVSIYGSMDIWFGIILTIIGVFAILAAASPKTGRWIRRDRMAN